MSEEHDYIADPDYLVTAIAWDDTLGRVRPVEVRYAYRGERGAVTLYLLTDARSRQLVYEAGTLTLAPFRRKRPAEKRPPGGRPRRARAWQATPSSSR